MQYFGKPACQMYVEPRPKPIRSMNINDCAKMVAIQEYIGKISGIRYYWKRGDMIKSKDENKAQVRPGRYSI